MRKPPSKKPGKSIDLRKVRLYPIRERVNKTSVRDFLEPGSEIGPFHSADLEKLAERMVESHRRKNAIIAMLGAHLIKCGLSLYVIDLMEKGVVTHVALNGAGAIHDFEIALIGATSEHVEQSLTDGSFGMAKETGIINEIVKNSRAGFGQSVGEYIERNLKYRRYSILANAYRLNLPATVHVAIGTDIIHQHPNFDAAATGRATYDDFRILLASVSQLQGGVVLNVGSAVILPEVFLKALSTARNLKYEVREFTSANLDMISHYRPRVNVVERPTADGGEGFNIIERHEKTIPYLYRKVAESLDS